MTEARNSPIANAALQMLFTAQVYSLRAIRLMTVVGSLITPDQTDDQQER